MRNLPDIGKFIKHDPQRFVVGSLANQIRVLIQRMRMRGYQPWKILLSPGLRYALRLESESSMQSNDYRRHDQGDTFMGFPIVVDKTVEEPIIMIKPELRDRPLEQGRSTPEEVAWKRRKQFAN